ncbi:LuxR C-terminal-related transcriptional regulator [Arthrobacter sp. NPDC093125]|uniref:helix-turn-helix transcriptional regulator n=1 Tax=Arthrobacter sp. NPDC093125 TaxID=3363944 RepID=UPI0037F2A37E
MARNDAQYRLWLELVGEILQQPLGLSSRYEGQLLELLGQSFNGACIARNRVTPEWENHILALWPRDYLPDQPPVDYDFRQHPLLRWFALTRQPGPQSYGRVPDALASSSLKQAWEELARPWGITHQLSISLQIGGGDHNVGSGDYEAYVIHRPDRDYTEQEFDLARLLQPILNGLALHLALAPQEGKAARQSCSYGLTLREMSILTLLSEGLTAESLARRLSISPRTAGKHLEHIYRKLDVGDRLMAVQRAYELGLLKPAPGNLLQNQRLESKTR